jgi:sigma-B regulation protein RsbU (phosphoserine phosphatase)
LSDALTRKVERGGDFYDLLPYGSGRLALALGDVSGKGTTAAALLSALAIGILRTQ